MPALNFQQQFIMPILTGSKTRTILDLFSGIGGMTLGLERTGYFKTKAFCEIDPWCRRTLRKHWPDTSIFEGVTKLKGSDIGAIVAKHQLNELLTPVET